MAQSRDFFIEFEKRMLSDYRRRTCHEKEVEEGGKAWVYRMKIEADEWQYKTEYYERMKKMTSREHIGRLGGGVRTGACCGNKVL